MSERSTPTPAPVADSLFREGVRAPKYFSQRATWRDVARAYYHAGLQYLRENDRHLAEIAQQKNEYGQWKIDHLDRSTKEYSRLQEEIKRRDGEIDQLRATIHLLTRPGR